MNEKFELRNEATESDRNRAEKIQTIVGLASKMTSIMPERKLLEYAMESLEDYPKDTARAEKILSIIESESVEATAIAIANLCRTYSHGHRSDEEHERSCQRIQEWLVLGTPRIV